MNRMNAIPLRMIALSVVALLSVGTACGTDPAEGGGGARPDGSPAGNDTSAADSGAFTPANDAGPGATDVQEGTDTSAADVGAMGSDVGAVGSDVAPRADGGPVPPAGTQKEMIGQLLASISQADVTAANMELYAMSLPNRASGSANYRRATEWAKTWVEMKAPSTKVTFIEQAGLRNTEIVLPGTDPTAGMYIIGGHLDSVAAGPGMDDDGSGSVGTMFVAMALSKYRFKSEVRFMLFDAEERGYVGSGQYARALRETCEPTTCLKLFINLDMISNDPSNRARISVTTTDMPLRALHTQINTEHMIGAVLVFGGNQCGSSDDCSFQRSGYKTIEIKEAEFSPNWHRASDTVANQNLATMTKNIKLAAGVLASLAGIEGPRP